MDKEVDDLERNLMVVERLMKNDSYQIKKEQSAVDRLMNLKTSLGCCKKPVVKSTNPRLMNNSLGRDGLSKTQASQVWNDTSKKLLEIKKAKLDLMKKLNENNEDEVKSLKQQLEEKKFKASVLRESVYSQTQDSNSILYDEIENTNNNILGDLDETPKRRLRDKVQRLSFRRFQNERVQTEEALDRSFATTGRLRESVNSSTMY